MLFRKKSYLEKMLRQITVLDMQLIKLSCVAFGLMLAGFKTNRSKSLLVSGCLCSINNKASYDFV